MNAQPNSENFLKHALAAQQKGQLELAEKHCIA